MTSSQPPGLQTRRSSRSVARSSGVCSITSRQVIRSNVAVLPGQLLEPADPDLAGAAAARHLGRVGVELDPGHLAVVGQLLERAARAAAGVEHLGVGWAAAAGRARRG